MGHTRCWVSRSIAIVNLVAVTLITGSAVLVVVTGWWRAHTDGSPLAYATQLEVTGTGWLNRLLLAHGAAVGLSLACVALLSFGLLVAELRGLMIAPRLVLSRGALGEVSVQIEQVGKLAQREAEHVSGVREVKTTAQSGRTGIAVRQQIVVEPQFVFTMLAAQVQERVKQSLEHHLGLPVNSVRVTLQPTSMRKAVL